MVDPVEGSLSDAVVVDAVVDEDVAVAGRQREQTVWAETIKYLFLLFLKTPTYFFYPLKQERNAKYYKVTTQLAPSAT